MDANTDDIRKVLDTFAAQFQKGPAAGDVTLSTTGVELRALEAEIADIRGDLPQVTLTQDEQRTFGASRTPLLQELLRTGAEAQREYNAEASAAGHRPISTGAPPELLLQVADRDMAIGRIIQAGQMIASGGYVGASLTLARMVKRTDLVLGWVAPRLSDGAVPKDERSVLRNVFTEAFRMQGELRRRREAARAAAERKLQPLQQQIDQHRQDTQDTQAIDTFVTRVKHPTNI